HDVLFIGRPETNSALASYARGVGLNYDGGVFQISGKNHGSETEALFWAAKNPANDSRMVLVAGGNSPLSTATLTRKGVVRVHDQIFDAGRAAESGFLSTK